MLTLESCGIRMQTYNCDASRTRYGRSSMAKCVHWLGICLLAAAASGPAAAVTVAPKATIEIYDCKDVGTSHNVPREIYLFYEPASHHVQVFDGAVKATYGKPIDATVHEDTPAHLVLKWTVHDYPGKDSHGGPMQFDLHFSATYVKSNGNLFETMRYGGGSDNPMYHGEFSCVRK